MNERTNELRYCELLAPRNRLRAGDRESRCPLTGLLTDGSSLVREGHPEHFTPAVRRPVVLPPGPWHEVVPPAASVVVVITNIYAILASHNYNELTSNPLQGRYRYYVQKGSMKRLTPPQGAQLIRSRLRFGSDLTPKSLLLLRHRSRFWKYFKLCPGLLSRWLFNLSLIATLFISNLFSGEQSWYRKQASPWERLPGRAADISRGPWRVG